MCNTNEPVVLNEELAAEALLPEEIIAIPVSYFEDLIRAQTERDVLEAAIEHCKYDTTDVLKAIREARKFREVPIAGNNKPLAPLTPLATEDVSEDA